MQKAMLTAYERADLETALAEGMVCPRTMEEVHAYLMPKRWEARQLLRQKMKALPKPHAPRKDRLRATEPRRVPRCKTHHM